VCNRFFLNTKTSWQTFYKKTKNMITKEQLEELNNLKCLEHGDKPKAKYIEEDINFEFCCENFNQQIQKFVRDKTLSNIQELTRKSLGI
jgi:hypothetical protein